MSIILEEKLNDFKLGWNICEDMIQDFIHHQSPHYNIEIHLTRMEGLEHPDLAESLGYLASVGKHCLLHPLVMYDVFSRGWK